MKTLYTVTVTYTIGHKRYNEFIRALDLGMEGLCVTDSITYRTRTIPDKTYIKRMRKKLLQFFTKQQKEVFELTMTTTPKIPENKTKQVKLTKNASLQ